MHNTNSLSEKDMLYDVLTMEKQIISAYNTGITEASCKNLRQTLTTALTDSQEIQYQIFDTMKKHGIYSPKNAEQQEVQNAKQKFTQIKSEL